MQHARIANVQSNINVTPLVDVVLVLLIIFMVIAPQLAAGPDSLQLPVTDQPPDKPDDGKQILVAITEDGTLWIGDDAVEAAAFTDGLQAVKAEKPDHKVVIKGDARLTFGQVRDAMLAVESVGFGDVGLIAERRVQPGAEG